MQRAALVVPSRPVRRSLDVPFEVSPPPRFARALAALATVLIAFRLDIAPGLTAGTVVSIVFAPMWIPAALRYWGFRWFFGVSALAVVSGLWLAAVAAVDHRIVPASMIASSLLILGCAASVGLLLWARSLMHDARVGALFGVGLVLGVRPDSNLFATNPWRFGFSVAVTILVLAIVSRWGNHGLELVAVLVFTAVAGLTDARSTFALLLLTGILLLWQLRPWRRGRTGSVFSVVIGLPLIGLVVYNLGQALILDGYLGETTRARSQLQVDTSGSLILGGRPEIAATTSLMQYQPWGFGSGVIPTLSDITAAKSGMAAINYQPNNGYVEKYMFGTGFEVHSVIGDMWADYGIPGLLLAATVLFLTFRTLGIRVASGTASALLVFLTVKCAWSMAFGPLYSAIPLVTLLLGLALIRRDPPIRGTVALGRRGRT